MQATGIVRRMDDLGRVVIPKEIRRTMRIKDGDPLEIYTIPNENAIVFKKYAPFDSEIMLKGWNIIKPIIPCGFTLLDSNEEWAVGGKFYDRPYTEVKVDNDIVAYIALAEAADYPNCAKEVGLAAKVLSKYFEED